MNWRPSIFLRIWIFPVFSVLVINFVSTLTYFTTATPAYADDIEIADTCATTTIPLAGCDTRERHFRSVVLAIHGWNGDCKSTFGENEENILSVIKTGRFYDVDCFDYNSHQHSLTTSTRRLRNKLLDLQSAGYRELVLVTHSTGGVLALNLIMEEAFEEGFANLKPHDNASFLFDQKEGLKLRALHAWAAPINGVELLPSFYQTFISWFGNEDENKVLQDLNGGSEFMVALRAKFKRFNELIILGTNAERVRKKVRYQFNFVAFQGQNNDFVVEPIQKSNDWWPHNLDAELIDTETFHLFNVGKAGNPLAPTFPALAEKDKALITLNLKPRYESFFAPEVLQTAVLDKQQRTVIGGIVNYTTEPKFFHSARQEISEMVKRLLVVPFPRTAQFDEFAVLEIGSLVEEKVLQQDLPKAVELADQLVKDFELKFKEYDITDTNSFGGGSFRAARQLSDFINRTFDFVIEQVGADPSLEQYLHHSDQSLAEFEKRVGRLLTTNIQISDDDILKRKTLEGMENYVKTASAEAVENTDTVAVMAGFARNQYNFLNANDKTITGEVLAALSTKSPKLTRETVDALNTKVNWLGNANTPLWQPILNKEQIRIVTANIPTEQLPETEILKFVTDIIKLGGPEGNQRALINATGIKAFKDLSTIEKSISDAAIKEVFSAGRESPYPNSLERSFVRELQQLQRGYLLP